MTGFEDHFSKQSRDYALYRPRYPDELFAYLASIAPRRALAWDCGTGNGQAALGLAAHFNRVVATDASPDQVELAVPHERIEYRVGRAEELTLETGSVDLVTVAVAVHWFDLETFYGVVRRVSVEHGVLAVWTYHLPVIEPPIDRILTDYFTRVLSGCWPERFRYVAERYRTLPFPFIELAPPDFTMESSWNLDELAGFLNSWSATQRYLAGRGEHPLSVIWGELREAWGDPGLRRRVRWPLHVRVGRVK